MNFHTHDQYLRVVYSTVTIVVKLLYIYKNARSMQSPSDRLNSPRKIPANLVCTHVPSFLKNYVQLNSLINTELFLSEFG